MQAETQRQSPRVPLGVLVELEHEDFDETFEADGVDLGVGGLGMRAAFLPDVGSRMKATFAAPGAGPRIEAPCEVVWARDSGPHVGQVGLRFTSLEPSARQAIEAMMAPASEPEVERPSLRHVVEPALEELASDEHTAVRLFVDGTSAAIPARVLARYDGGVRVVQRLGLFRLGTRVDVQNGSTRCSRIEGVTIRTDGDVPELILDLALEPHAGGAYSSVDEPAASAPHGGAPSSALELDDFEMPEGADTIPDLPAPEPAAEEPALRKASSVRASAPQASIVSQTPTPVVDVIRPFGLRDAAAPMPARPLPPVLEERAPEARRSARAVMDQGLLRARHLMRRLRAMCVAAFALAAPALGRVRVASRTLLVRGRPMVLGTAARTAARTGHFVTLLRGKIGARVPWIAPARKRRMTAPPPARSNVAAKQRPSAKAAPAARSERLRTALLAIAAFAGAAALVYALSPGVDDTVDVHRELQAPAEVVEVPAQEEGALEAAPEQVANPPTPGTVPPSSPYAATADELDEAPAGVRAAAAPELTRAFGADSVPEGRSFLLRMSQPVERIRGMAEPNGFTVVVPDSLSLDRAGPIAAAHPAVDRAIVLNRGDHAELSIRFVQGRQPAYRVAGRGRAIEIVLGP
jgi:hypothetical protein